jgi:hypothetical protein
MESFMADKYHMAPSAAPRRPPEADRADANEKITVPEVGAKEQPHHRPARPDPRTGEVPAGPGDSGLQDRPEANKGSPGTRQMSNRRLVIVLGITALLAAVVFLFGALF